MLYVIYGTAFFQRDTIFSFFSSRDKKGSVFVSVDNHSVYLVNGIIDSWAEMFPDIPLPIIVKATLLPFRNVIISDGLVSAFPIRFGRNIAMDLKETYLTAKQQGRIITNL